MIEIIEILRQNECAKSRKIAPHSGEGCVNFDLEPQHPRRDEVSAPSRGHRLVSVFDLDFSSGPNLWFTIRSSIRHLSRNFPQ